VVILLSFLLFSIFGDGHVPTTRTAGRDPSILAPFLGRVGMMMTTVIPTMAMALEWIITGLRQ
jgi:hypothetical protein